MFYINRGKYRNLLAMECIQSTLGMVNFGFSVCRLCDGLLNDKFFVQIMRVRLINIANHLGSSLDN